MKYKSMHIIFFSLLLASVMYDFNSTYMVEYELMSLPSWNLTLKFIIDKESMIFVFTVLSIFSSVYYYSTGYYVHPFSKRFLMTMVMFFASMMLLIFSGNLFTSFIGWDGLGVTSFFLILFFSSFSSFHASYLTFIVNRLGDCFFIVSIVFSMMYSLDSLMKNNFTIFGGVFLLSASVTKSAQYPFSSWLPAAMEAPTPVSALVHSSTLVTAGIYLLFRYQSEWIDINYLSELLMFLSLITVLMASSSAMVENDMKKIIALSTLSQLGFIMLTLSLSFFDQAFFHLIMHAFFKALMFMAAGMIIHAWMGWQNLSKVYISKYCSPVGSLMFSFANLALCGVPFLAGFYSKDNIIDRLYSKDLDFTMMMVMISFFLSVAYTARLVHHISLYSSPWGAMSDDDMIMINSMFYLLMLSVTMGSIMTWMFNLPLSSIPYSKMLLVMLLIMTFLYVMRLYYEPSLMTKYVLYSKWLLSMISVPILKAWFNLSKFDMFEHMFLLMNKESINYLSVTSQNVIMKPLLGKPEYYLLWVLMMVSLSI